jgi:non-specific serine/threonine protein kinase
LRREGEYWTIEFAGMSFRLRDTKGLHYLALLVSEPGREFLALDLVKATTAIGPAGPRDLPDDLRPALGDAGVALDEQAKSAYRARLHELQSDLDEAESWHDAERAERARDEMDFIARELAHAVGLGGRDRVAGSATERARLSVTRAIRLAMKRIASHHRPLAEHLERSVHTGTYCAYRPDPGLSIQWELD